MKKLLLVAVAVGMTMSGFAQYNTGKPIQIPAGEEVKLEENSRFGNEKTDVLTWFAYAEEQRSLGGRTWGATPIFEDTTVLVEFSDVGFRSPSFNNVGQIFDPKGPLWFSQTIKLDSNDAYTVDSIAVPYSYQRFQTAVPDTLKVRIFTHSALPGYTLSNSSGPVATFKSPDYDNSINEGINQVDEVIILLDGDDTTAANTFRYTLLPANINVDRGEIMGVTMTYTAGNAWSPGDTLRALNATVNNQLNRFSCVYDADDTKTYQMGFFNAGLFIVPEQRYGDLSGWETVFLPGQAFNSYLNVGVQFKLNATNVGINETADLGFAVRQNYPNPFSNQTVIEYALNTPANVNLEIFDITGKSVAVVNEGFKNVGNHKVEIDGSNLKNGVYYYTFRTEAGQTTKKMLIQR